MNGNDIKEETVSWIRRNYTFFDSIWKVTEIEELVAAEKIQEKVIIEKNNKK
jgi:hypothetical protein